jgi:ferrous iron transport protein B
MDLARKKGLEIDLAGLERELGVPVVAVNPRKNKGIAQLKKAIAQTAGHLYKVPSWDFIANKELAQEAIEDVQKQFPSLSNYGAIHYLINHEHFSFNGPLQKKNRIDRS